MCWCSFNANDPFNGLLSQDGVAETGRYVRELLVVPPLDFPFVAPIVIVVRRRGPILKSLLVVDFLGLREPGSGGLSPSVIELEVDVVEMAV